MDKISDNAVNALDITGKLVLKYPTLSDAVKGLGISKQAISQHCLLNARGLNSLSLGKYYLRYERDMEIQQVKKISLTSITKSKDNLPPKKKETERRMGDYILFKNGASYSPKD